MTSDLPSGPLPAASRQTPLAQRTVSERPLPRGGTLELVDSDFMVAALDGRWRPAESGRNDLLLIDPPGRVAHGVMDALTTTTGSPVSSVRVLSPAGLQELAHIDELRLPAGPGLPRLVRHLQIRRLDPVHPSPALSRVWQQTRVGVVLLDRLPPDAAGRWLLSLGALVRRLGDDSPQWAVFYPQGPHAVAARALPHGLQRLHLCAPLPTSAGAAAQWNALFKAWEHLR